MKITFVHHSCFVVELESHILVFDYFDGNKRNASSLAMVVGASCMVNIHDKKR